MDETHIEEGTGEIGEDDPREALTYAIARYRDMVAAGVGIIAEMVQGTTVAEIDASAQKAREAYNEVSRRIAAEHEREVPLGNTARSAQAAGTGLRPEAKIALGLRGK